MNILQIWMKYRYYYKIYCKLTRSHTVGSQRESTSEILLFLIILIYFTANAFKLYDSTN